MKYAIPAPTREMQRLASDPGLSAWVSAHAGSGKTHVLAQRVVRLLLAGAPPARLLCLTFTKAAAANMAERVFQTLAGWTLMDDETLYAEIRATGAEPPRQLDLARRLFATTVETPGGLKIQTIHAFCERVLHLFPFEANVPADFRVLDDLECIDLTNLARRQMLDAAGADGELAASLARVAGETWDGGFDEALQAAFARRDLLREPGALLARLPHALGLEPQEDEQSVRRRMVEGGIGREGWAAIASLFEQGGTEDRKKAVLLRRVASLAPDPACLRDYLVFFFTENGEGPPRARLCSKEVVKLAPDLPARLAAESRRLEQLRDRLKAAAACARSAALLRLAADCLKRYEELKRARGVLDFDDLIARTRDLLLRDGASAWVLYKLDGGIDHILVDEAQDTSEAQWEILRALAAEFTSGSGARAGLRTFFAVGDEKQSIFSFQGAAPEAFDRMRRLFEKRTREAEQIFAPVALQLSFRSSPTILRAVDLVFAQPHALRGLTVTPDVPPNHLALKKDICGLVEIWEPIKGDRTPDPEDWALPVDLPRETDPPVELARCVARKISALTARDSRERVHDTQSGSLRPISPGDVMILVRRRGVLFEALVRALKEYRVPVAGADRLDVAGHIAVMDLLAAARAALSPDDDLSVACALKSPLCGLTDEDLIAVAPRRHGSLSEAVSRRDEPRFRNAAARLADWRQRSHEKPFDFFSRILGPDGGRSAFLARLGPEAGDAIDEFMALALEHERVQAPSLAAFAHEIETLDLTVKRDMEAAGGLVRVMTVHAAKGLEAKIVFLPDTCATPSASHDPKLYEVDTPAGPTLAWSVRKGDDPPAIAQRRAAAQAAADDEYRRLLYVALTRAEERLYVAGYFGAREPAPTCWRNLIVDALREHCEEVVDLDAPGGGVLRLGAPTLGAEASNPPSACDIAAPGWLREPAPRELQPAPPPRPSSALAGADAAEAPGRSADGGTAARGMLIHGLLQGLPTIEADRRPEAALRFLRAQAKGLSHAEALAMGQEATAALEASGGAALFGARSRAEVAIAARIPRAGKDAFEIVGRIDRLAEVGDEIWIADFKTGAIPVALPQSYAAQLGLYRAAVAQLYPGKAVRAFVLWTAAPRLDEVPLADLEKALEAL